MKIPILLITSILALPSIAFAKNSTSIESGTIDSSPSTPEVILVAQTNKRQHIASDEHVLGVCDVVNINGGGQLDLTPEIWANAYFRTKVATIDPSKAIITILQQPKHGHLEPDSRGDWWDAKYITNDGYLGNDEFVMQVKGSGHIVKLKYFIAVTDDWGVRANPNPICKGPIWKISQDANGNPARRLG